MHVAVIGAGPAGITAAYQLAKAGVRVTVFEAGGAVGGLARSLELWGQRVDLGPHRFFSNDARINRLWLEVVGRDYRMVDRLTRIFYERKLYDYPLSPANALWNMGVPDAAACMASYLWQKARGWSDRDRATFEDSVVSRFGRRLYRMFFKPYSEKLWGIPCTDLDADFAAQRIKRFSLGQAALAALGIGRARHKTLVDQFAYPLAGTGAVYQRMADAVRRHGGTVALSTPVAGVALENRRAAGVRMPDGSLRRFDHVISTMPLTLMVKSLGPLPPAVAHAVDNLHYRNTIIVYLHVDHDSLFPDQWLYVHSPELAFGRLTNFRNWVPELCGDAHTTILALEYWCFDTDALWRTPDPDLVSLARNELAHTGLLNDAPVLDGHVVRIPRSYPVYRSGYKQLLAPVVDFLSSIPNITPIGRYGAFKYNNQDHSILMGMLAAENLTHHSSHDLWRINTDYDDYHESATISATGLVNEAVAC